jgi:hypothetical protein
LNAARIATSVLPNPTSPHTSRSIGCARSMSRVTSRMAEDWSGVSSYGNDADNARSAAVSGGKAVPLSTSRAA